MTDYPDWQRNGADSYALAIDEIRKHGWRCPANAPERCRDPQCWGNGRTGTCKHNGQSILPPPVQIGEVAKRFLEGCDK